MKKKEAKEQEYIKGRVDKAKKIIAVLEDYLNKDIKNMRILDIGTGHGVIANYIASLNNEVISVDVKNSVCLESEQLFKLQLVDNEYLPFENDSFDIVISNHVIEHVNDQHLHLREIHRVLKRDGVCYFAVPNRYFIREPHFDMFFIHYLPKGLAHKVFSKFGKTGIIDLSGYHKTKRMLKDEGFIFEEYTVKIINDPSRYSMKSPLKVKLPEFLKTVSPTNVFILFKQKKDVRKVQK